MPSRASQQPSPSTLTASALSGFTAGAGTDSLILSPPTTPTPAAITAAPPPPAATAAPAAAAEATAVASEHTSTTIDKSLILSRPSGQTGSAPKDPPKRPAKYDASPSPQQPANPSKRLSSPSGVALDLGNGQTSAAECAKGGQAV